VFIKTRRKDFIVENPRKSKMVNVEKRFGVYFQTFVRVIPQRAKVVRALLTQKNRLDAEFLKKGFVDEKSIEKWKSLVGEDTLFRSAEKKKEQTIRHHLWKIQKSVGNLKKWRGVMESKIEAGLYADTAFSKAENAKLLENLDRAIGHATDYYSPLDRMDKYMQGQMAAVIERDLNKFKRELEYQQYEAENLRNLSVEIRRNAMTLGGFVERLKETDIRGSRFAAYVVGMWLFVLFSAAISAVFFEMMPKLMGSVSYSTHEQFNTVVMYSSIVATLLLSGGLIAQAKDAVSSMINFMKETI